MQLKKILVSLLVAMMILSTAVVGAAAEDVLLTTAAGEALTIAVETKTAADEEGNVSAKAGDTVEVSVVIKTNPGAALLQLSLKYDAEALTPVKGADGKVAIESGVYKFEDSVLGMNGIDTSVPGIIRMTADLNNKIDITAAGVIAKLSFKIGEKFDGNAVIEVVDENAYKASYAKVEIAKTNLNLLVHDFGEGKVTAPTCTEEGFTVSTCKNCGAEVKSDVVEATGHKAVAVPAVAATCNTTGLTEGSKCSVCDEILVAQEEVPTNDDHTPVEIPAVAATCTTEGTTAGSKCSACGEVLQAPGVAEKIAHTPESIPAVEPTYSEDGATEGSKCSVCGEILQAPEVIEAKSLTWLWIVIAVVVVLGAGCAVYFFVIKKKK